MAYEFKTKPYAHQKEALKRSRGREGYAWLMEMGTGKTKVAIDEIGILADEGTIDAAVVIAPKGVYANWPNIEFPAHMPDDIRDRAMIYLWDNYANSRSKFLAQKLLDYKGLAILVMNVEAIGASTKAQKYIETFLKKRRAAMYVDEATTIKNPAALRTKYLTKVAPLALMRRIMTGSPVTRSPLDFFAQFNFLKPGLIGSRNFHAFRARYAVMQNKVFGGRSVNLVVGYRNLEELTANVQEHSYRVTKDQCLDLPPKVYVRREVALTDEQRRVYTDMTEVAISELGEGVFVSAQAAIVLIMRLHQIVCGHVTDADGNLVRLKSNRVDALMEVCDELDGKCIVWSRYREDIRNISQRLREEYGDEAVVEYHGSVDSVDRAVAVERFQNDPTCRFFVANQQTGGYGITLTAASNVIYYSNDYDLEKRLQSEDRAHRSGQTKSVTYVDLVAPKTVDDKILASLLAKKNVADLVTGDALKDWFSI